MNNLPQSSAERAMEGFAQRITAQLDEATGHLDYHVVERLRAGRVQALAHRRKPMSVRKPVPVLTRLGASLAWGGSSGGGSGSWWHSLLAAVPMLALVAGIMVIGAAQDETGVMEIAEVDAALLASDLPPAAYADPGFVQFLKARAEESH
ncbi:DUF3619 family protein [Simplicispira suum]|uniref:DUF3619 domain-containing protein n=1 Tax=Simplicispira suum TaxID=2109915 RepID=A0A2S0MVN0_9BURK|nr:DUF3619 family protein [Simplicispira suum]AVO39935.1 DUF3619 domain-containing protein [Simplicispira suum]MBW7834698.1 DUF3619 family protein [Simplicispira suum]